MNSSSTVSAELGLRLVVPQQTIVPLMASLFYSREDPYAIRIAFHVGLDEPVEWIFARDLLAMGIEGREGRVARASVTSRCGRRPAPRAASQAAC